MDSKYARMEVIGQGAFGKAYLCKNLEENKLCVVKQIDTSKLTLKEREAAAKEAVLLKKMSHPNIVQFQEVFLTKKGRLCIVMDYADSGDVHSALQKRAGELLPEETVRAWFVQVSLALQHVHDQRVLHRDLKTQNVFLMKTGQVKLGDFGIARVLEATKDYAKTMVGTPYYLSPEIIQDRPYRYKSDVWSLGVVLFEICTLTKPFDAESLVLLAGKILQAKIPSIDKKYSSDLASLIESMLSRDESLRPTAREVLQRQFLTSTMEEVNEKYDLKLDLSDFITPPTAPAEEKSGSLAAVASPRAGEEAVHDQDGFEGSDDENKCESELEKSVSNLRLSVAANSTGADSDSRGGLAATVPLSPSNSNSHAAAEVGAHAAQAKAAKLRDYLAAELSEPKFNSVYDVVKNSSDLPPQDLRKKVVDVIGAERTEALLSLVQLLCFLQDAAASAKSLLQEQIVQAFKKWDKNGDGRISKAELREVFVHLGIGAKEADASFLAGDTNKDNFVDYTEFVAWLFSDTPPDRIRQEVRAQTVEEQLPETKGRRASSASSS